MKVRDVIGEDARVTTGSRGDFKPDITIVTPTYRRNAEGLLRRCLESAQAQTFTNYEHIIIDDGSSDGTEELVLELCKQDERIVYVRHDRNSGLPAVRTNEGILRARGRAVAFLFDDNVFKPDFLAAALKLLDTSGADVVHGDVNIPTANGKNVLFGATPVTLDLLRASNTIANGGVLIRRDFFDRFGLYDPHLAARRLCDWELWMRALWLGARFQHLPQVVAEELGHISKTSLGNTVALDPQVTFAYVQDTRNYADRAKRLRPSAILDENVLDPERVRPYVRDGGEWAAFANSTYRPFLESRQAGFDPLLLTNRTESIDPAEGWNPTWAFHRRRFRLLFVANALPALAVVFMEGAVAVPGAIVLNCNEWQLSSFEPGSVDLIVSLDGASGSLVNLLEQHRAAGARLIYFSAYGEQPNASGMPFDEVAWSASPDLEKLFGNSLPYFPQPGAARPAAFAKPARLLQEMADIVLTSEPSDHPGSIVLPRIPSPAFSTKGRRQDRRIAYRIKNTRIRASEIIARSTKTKGRHSAESLASIVISRPSCEIVVEQRDLDALPRAELMALACLASSHDVDIVTTGTGERLASASNDDRLFAAAEWRAWFGNLVRVARLRQRLNVRQRRPLSVDIYLNSELFAGSEVYGLHIAKLLSEFGVRTRVRLPERNIYGDPTAINQWLAEKGLSTAVRAPYLPTVHHTIYRPIEERGPAVAKLSEFIRRDRPDLILASGHVPQLAEVPDCPPLFMAFFSAAAYEQSWLRDLHGLLHGIMSDSYWALRPTAAVIGAPGRVIPSAVLGIGGSEIERITADAKRWPVRVTIAGTIIQRKRQLEAVQAVAELRRRGYQIELHLYGFELEVAKDYVALIDETIAAEGMNEHIVRHGFVEDATEITRNNDIVLCASTDESLPQGLIFQMYQGLVGVSVLCGGVDEMIINGKTGYLTRDPNPMGIAEVLARAVDDRANWPNIVREARRHIYDRCGAGNVTASLVDLFEEGLALRQPGLLELQARSQPSEQRRSKVALGAAAAVRRRPAQRTAHPAFSGATRVSDVIGEDARVTTGSKDDFRPDITIVTPTYRRNAEGLLRRCLESAQAQTFTNYEHIIIDDGSSDGTEELVLELCKQDERIVYVRHDRNSGLPAVRTNEGILRARGRAVAFLFDDNVLMPDFLADAMKLLDTSGADVVHGQVSMPFPGGTTYVIGGSPVTIDLLRGVNTIANGGVLIRREFFDRFGLYDPHLTARRLCDWELWMRALWLGARFQHLPQVVAEEGGVVSPTSLANTVAIDWKAVYGYLQDTTTYAERARRFSPSSILEEDVLDPLTIRRYVRDESEWQKVIDQIYRPFLERQGLDYDPALYSNRIASIDPMHGWNPDWALQRKRFRVLFLANAVPSFAAAMIEGIRAIPGAIVINCPEWHLSAFEPGSIDVIFVLDGTLSSLGSVLDAHREAGARVAYLSLYGSQDGTPPFGLRDHSTDPYLFSIFGSVLPYFPQTGVGLRGQQVETGQAIRSLSDVVIGATAGDRGEIALPPFPIASFPAPGLAALTIAYRLPSAADVPSADEVIAREQDAGLPGSTHSLVSLVISRPGAEIVIDAADHAALPLPDLIGLSCLATERGVGIITRGSPAHAHSAATRAMIASQWSGWFGNIARLLRLQQVLGLPAATRLTVDFYLNSELFSGSEAYGLGLAKCLHDLGVAVRIRIPQTPVYGSEHIAINDWLAKEGLPLATRAPYIQGPVWTWQNAEDRASTLETLAAFVDQDPPDLIVASSYMPHLAHLHQRPPLFMALFSPAAYNQRETIELQGRVDAILSDSAWALRPWSALIGARGQVIRSTVFGIGGSQIDRVLGRSRDLPVRIAVAGTLQRRKRQLEAVKAVGILVRQGYDVELNLYGYALDALKDYVDEIDAAIRQAGLESRVRRHGFVEDSAEITTNNEIVLSASTDESLPQGLLFQMYEGLIGVAVLCGGIDEIVVDGETGYVTDDPAPLSIAKTLARAIDGRDEWLEISLRARQAIFEECGAPETTARILDLFLEGVALRAPSRPESHRAELPSVQGPSRTAQTAIAAGGPTRTGTISPASPAFFPAVQDAAAAIAPALAPPPAPVAGIDAAAPGKRVRLTFRSSGGRIGGVDVEAEAGSRVTGVLYSSVRPDLPLRRGTATADASGIARLRWPWTEGTSPHTFVLDLLVLPDAHRPDRRSLRGLLRGTRVRLRDVLHEARVEPA